MPFAARLIVSASPFVLAVLIALASAATSPFGISKTAASTPAVESTRADNKQETPSNNFLSIKVLLLLKAESRGQTHHTRVEFYASAERARRLFCSGGL